MANSESRTLSSMWDEHRGLGLLLVLSSGACLGLPRFPADGGDPDDDDAGTTAEPPPTVAPTVAPPEPEPVPPSMTTTPPLPTTSTGPGTTSTTTSPATVTTAPPPPDLGVPPIPDVGNSDYEGCVTYAVISEECQGGYMGNAYEFCVEYRMDLVSDYPECVPFFDEFLACLSGLDCEQFEMGFAECEPWLNGLFDCTG